MSSENSKNRSRTAVELVEELRRDPQHAVRVEQRDSERQRQAEEDARAAAPLVAELAAIGLAVSSVADLFNRRMDYRAAIPLLLTWLPKTTNPAVKECIVRALSVKWAKPVGAPLMVDEFERADDPSGIGLRWAIASALEVIADDSVFDEIVRLARDRRNGKAREMLVMALGQMQNPGAIGVLTEFLSDEDVAGYAVIALGRLKAKEARTLIVPFLRHGKSWVRKEAKRALSRIDK